MSVTLNKISALLNLVLDYFNTNSRLDLQQKLMAPGNSIGDRINHRKVSPSQINKKNKTI